MHSVNLLHPFTNIPSDTAYSAGSGNGLPKMKNYCKHSLRLFKNNMYSYLRSDNIAMNQQKLELVYLHMSARIHAIVNNLQSYSCILLVIPKHFIG